ncbi:hypothetical protein BH23PAT2_BH23PAT2_04890 [soil metagenome]
MDFLDPIKKRKHIRQLFIGYALMAVLIGLGTTILVLLSYGFSFDRTTGSVIQNGLVFIDTNPIAANVYVNGELRGRGDQRLVLPEGDYDLEIREDGYRSWTRSLNLRGGRVERFSYPFLFAQDLEKSTYRTFASQPRLMTTSPDRGWLLVQESQQIDAFVLYDLSQGVNLPAFFTLPPGIMTTSEPGSSLELVEWSNDNRHVVLKHMYDDGEEFILLDRDTPNVSQNLTSRFSDISFTTISLIDKQFDSYHLHDVVSGRLWSAELATDTSEVLLEDVLTYRSHGSDTILYVENTAPIQDNSGQSQAVRVRVLQGDQEYGIGSIPRRDGQDSYLLDIARYDGDWYMVIGSTSEKKISVYKNPVDTIRADPTKQLIPEVTLRSEVEPSKVSFSSNARNIMMQAEDEFSIYDLEQKERYLYAFGNQSNAQAFWLDGHRITVVADDMLRVIDFDGHNEQELVPCRASFRPLVDNGYEYLYCIAPSVNDDQYGTLQRTSLRYNKED